MNAESRSRTQPEAETSETASRSVPPPLSPAARASRRVIRALRLFRSFMAAWASSGRISTHCPRIWTSGSLSATRRSSSAFSSSIPPRARCRSKSTRVSRPIMPGDSGAGLMTARAVRFAFPAAHQGGIITPAPPSLRSGAASRRNLCASCTLSRTNLGRRDMSALPTGAKRRRARARSASRRSWAFALRSGGRGEADRQSAAAGIMALGSSTGWSRKRRRQRRFFPSPSPPAADLPGSAGSGRGGSSLKQVRNPSNGSAESTGATQPVTAMERWVSSPFSPGMNHGPADSAADEAGGALVPPAPAPFPSPRALSHRSAGDPPDTGRKCTRRTNPSTPARRKCRTSESRAGRAAGMARHASGMHRASRAIRSSTPGAERSGSQRASTPVSPRRGAVGTNRSRATVSRMSLAASENQRRSSPTAMPGGSSPRRGRATSQSGESPAGHETPGTSHGLMPISGDAPPLFPSWGPAGSSSGRASAGREAAGFRPRPGSSRRLEESLNQRL